MVSASRLSPGSIILIDMTKLFPHRFQHSLFVLFQTQFSLFFCSMSERNVNCQNKLSPRVSTLQSFTDSPFCFFLESPPAGVLLGCLPQAKQRARAKRVVKSIIAIGTKECEGIPTFDRTGVLGRLHSICCQQEQKSC